MEGVTRRMVSSSVDGDVIRDGVKEYYGKTLQSSQDLKTDACTLGKRQMSKHVREALALVNEEVTSKYYGCGLVAPELLENASILDLGSGSGQDCFVLSKLVGQHGHVTGLDMLDEQLTIARNNIKYHTKAFNYNHPNVHFVKGYIEKLKEAGLNDNTFDIIVSNCVLHLCADDEAVLTETYRALKVGGELYFSAMYVDRELPVEIQDDKVLWGEGISGAWDWRRLVYLAAGIGFSVPRLVRSCFMDIGQEIEEAVGDAKFVSATYRLFKLPEEKSRPGKVTYDGGILDCEDTFDLDHHYSFPKGEPVLVDTDVATILTASRFKAVLSVESSANCEQHCLSPQTEADVDPFLLAESENKAPVSKSCGPSKKTACT